MMIFQIVTTEWLKPRDCSSSNSVLNATFQSLAVALVIILIAYGNSVLIGLPTHLVRL